MKTKLVWFRNDLRTFDNETLSTAVERSDEIIPIYIFDKRSFLKTPLGFPKTGFFRSKFLLESIIALRNKLRALGGDLIVQQGFPEVIIPELCRQYKVTSVYFSKEVAPEEVAVENAVENELVKLGVNWRDTWSSTLLSKSDLPFSIPKLPDVFTAFRNKVEHDCKISSLIPTPNKIKIPTGIDVGEMPDISKLTIENKPADNRAAFPFLGGENEALERMKNYFWDNDHLKDYQTTRNGLIGIDYSSKFSAWLSSGCISARTIYHEVKKYEQTRIKNKSTYWLIFELLWRDFFRFTMEKNFTKLFKLNGFKGENKHELDSNLLNFENWSNGKTGIQFIDANMNELNATGFMSNRGRQNAASYLVNDLKVNWLFGAEYFESQLVDYDVCSNYGNWAYIAGVGNDPRPDRYFNIEKQAATYDTQKKYRQLWLT
jgi:deoxyribodipyrimidine photo-lyase